MAAEPVAAPFQPPPEVPAAEHAERWAEHIHGLVDERMHAIMRTLTYQNGIKDLMKPDMQSIHTRFDDLRNSNN